LLSYTNPIISATDAGARRTHTSPQWKREPDLAKIAHVCELHFEWGLKDAIIKRFRTVLWPSIVLRALRRSALEADTESVVQFTCSPVRERELPRDAPSTPTKVLARHFSSMALEVDSGEDDSSLGDLIVKIHASRMHAYTDGLLEYRLEIAPAQLVRLASAGIQGLRKPADTTYDVLPSESEDSDEVDEDGHAGACRKKKRRGGCPPPEPESHLRVWMPACMVRFALPDLVDRYEAALEAKRTKKSKPKAARGTAKVSAAKGKGKPALASRKAAEALSQPTDEEYFDLDVSSSGESDERASSLPPANNLRPPHTTTTSLQDASLQVHPKKNNDAMTHPVDDVLADYGLLTPADVVRQHKYLPQESPQLVSNVISVDDDIVDTPEPLKTRSHHQPSSPSKVLQRLDQNIKAGVDLLSKARSSPSSSQAPTLSSFSLPPRAALRPFPISFEEEEESSDDGCDDPNELFTFNGHDQHIMRYAAAPATPPRASSPPRMQWPRQPLPTVGQIVRKEEEEEPSDDPDTVPAALPVFRPLSSPREPPPLVLRRDTTSDVLNDNQHSRQQEQQPQTSSPSCSPSKVVRSYTRDGDFPPEHLLRVRRRRISERSSSSIISISTDSGASDDDNDGLLPRSRAPLMIARSRSAVSQRLATTSSQGVGHYRQRQKGTIEHEVIDLT
jgi:Holliday junction resolvase-like protein